MTKIAASARSFVSGTPIGLTADERSRLTILQGTQNLQDFLVVSGEELLSHWESSPGVRRFFAGCCGSPIFKREDATPQVLGFRLGTLDSDPSHKAGLHFMVGSKAPWVEIRDSLPQNARGIPFGERD